MTGVRNAIVACCAAFLLGGCEGASITDSVRGLMGTSPDEKVDMAFDESDPDRRREGIYELSGEDWGLQGDYLEAYALMLKSDKDPYVRVAAARALGKAGDAKYRPALVEALDDPSPAVRTAAARSLDSVPGDEAVQPLQKALAHDESADVRMWSARALRHYRSEGVLASLIEALDDTAFSVAHNARQSLKDITGRDLGGARADWAGQGAEDLLDETPREPKKRSLWRRVFGGGD